MKFEEEDKFKTTYDAYLKLLETEYSKNKVMK